MINPSNLKFPVITDKCLKSLVFSLFFLFCFTQNYAQTRSDLEAKRFGIIKDIEGTERSLTNLKNEKASSVLLLENLETQIASKKDLIKNIRSELKLIDDDLENLGTEKVIHKESLDALIREYGNLTFINYKNKLLGNKWALILNAKNLREALISWRYFKQLEKYISNQLNSIHTIKSKIQENNTQIGEDNKQKTQLLENESSLLEDIERQASEAKTFLEKLNDDEKKLKSTLDNQRDKREQLNQAIQDFILKSFSAYDEVSQNLDKVNPFEHKRGFHKWPLENGMIISRFGKQDHPEIQGIIVNNSGIDIVSSSDNIAKSISSGKVIKVETISPGEQTVIIEHDFNYFSIYTHLNQVFVNENERVNENQTLASLHKIKDGRYKLHLEIRRGQDVLNPIQWLKNK